MTDVLEAPVTPEPPQSRSTADVLAGRMRVTLAGQQYVMPVLTIGQNRDWMESLETDLQPLLDRAESVEEAVAVMTEFSDRLLPFVRSYDVTGVLPPPGDWERDIYPHELLRAVMEVRLAADPMTSYAVAALSEEMLRPTSVGTMTPPPDTGNTSSSRRPTAGRRRKSKRR